MTTLEKQIYEIISKANGIKGSDIANALQLDKRTETLLFHRALH